MIKVPPGPDIVRGLDTSHYDESINFKKVKASGREFVFQKCTEYNADNTYARNKKAAQKAKLLFGAYHFFHPSRDAKTQAELFLKTAMLMPGDLRPVLDWESTDNLPSLSDRTRGKVWLDIVEMACGKPPIIYGSPYFLQDLFLDESFSHYPLWIAHYGTSAPLVPGPWKNWNFWQHTDKGSVSGIPAPDEDLDMFNGTLESLKKMVI